MKEIQLKCNINGNIAIDDITKTEGLNVVLVNRNGIPLARYSFDSNKINHKKQICYTANNYKIAFDIMPSMIYEHMTSY